MSKIEELISQKFFPDQLENLGYVEKIITDLMKEYAEIYAKRCLEIASENVEMFEEGFYNRIDDLEYKWSIDKGSILNIDLPEHE